MLPSAGPAIRESPPLPIFPITSSADAILIRCTNHRTIDFIERLEKEFRGPMVRKDPAIFWAALRPIGCRERIRGFRKVLRDFEDRRWLNRRQMGEGIRGMSTSFFKEGGHRP